MAEDKMVKDVRSRLKSIAAKGGKYFTGTAKLFLASGTEIVNVNMPTLSGMMDVNRDLMNDTVRFLRNPVDTVNRNIDRAMSTEGWRAFQKFAKNAIDDLKTGELYDPTRDRSSFGEGIDALLDNFGDFDMSGFDEDGTYNDEGTDNGDFARDVALAESHEQAEDVRTQATIEAIAASTRASVNTANANAQSNIRMSIKQHAQLMGGMQNMVTQQAATLTAVNAMASSMLDVQREAHNQMMAQMKTVTDLLTEIRDNTAPKVPDKFEPPAESDLIGAYGQIDVRKWMKAAYKNADEKYGISSAISMATGGMDMKTMFELAGDNPLQLVTDMILGQVFDKSGVKKSMERTGKYMQGFFPALLDKLADRGRRFGKSQEEGGGKLLDFFAGMLGVQTKAKGSIETGMKDPSAQAMLTNRTVHAIEQVIPMWLSKIYSAISGDPLQTYNYSTGKLTNVAQALAKQHHDVNDVAGRMGGAAYQVTRRAEAIKLGKVEDEAAFQDWMYQFLQKAAREGRHIDPWKSKDEWNDMLPEGGHGDKEKYFSMLAKAILKTMPRNQLMALSAEMSDARVSQTRAAATLNNENRENGMGIIHSGMLGDLYADEIEAQSKGKRVGLTDYGVDKLMKKKQAYALQNGLGVQATNRIMSDVLTTLQKGIITYTYIIGDYRGAGGTRHRGRSRPNIPGLDRDVLDGVLADAESARELVGGIRQAERDDDRREREWKREQQEKRDREILSTTSGIEDVIFTQNMNEDDMARVLQHLIVSETKDNASDNPNVERSRGYITSHIQKFKSKIGFDPKKTLGDNLKNFVTTAPFELIKSGLELSDALMFKVIFGQDTEGLIDGSEDQPSLMRALSTSIKGHWKQAATWFGEHIGKPLKSFLFDEKNGLLTRLGARVNEIFGEPVKQAAQKMRSSIIGEKELDADGKETGRYTGGKLSGLINRTKERAGSIRDSVAGAGVDGRPSIIDTFLYGDYTDTKRKGVKYVRDRGANGRFAGGHYEYQGFMGKMKRAQDSFMDMMFGPDENGDDHDSRKKAKFIAEELNKAAPDMIIGAGAMTALNAGMGLLTGLALPGGPLIAPLLGAGLSFASSSEAFKKFLFGDQIEEEQEHYDMKTGRMVKSKVKTRKGSDLISKEVYEGIKRFAPKVAIGSIAGALAGGVGLLPFGMGPIIGTVLGSIGGMTAASDQLKKMIFGDADSEEGDDSGLISKNFRKKLLKGIAEHGGGAVVGRLAGGAAGLLAGGILPGAFGAILGPVLGTAGTVIGAISGPKLMDMLFGEEQDIKVTDAEGKETGKVVKKRVGGMFGKMFDGVKTRMVEPLARGIDKVGHQIGDWFQESVVTPFGNALQPMKDAMKHAGEAVGSAMKSLTDNISGHIRDAMNNVLGTAVEHPLKEFFKEKVIKPLTNVTNKIFSTIGKIIGNIISAPFKAVEYIFAGTIGGKTPDELKDERQAKKDADRSSKLSDKVNKAQDALSSATSKFGRLFSFMNSGDDADAASPDGKRRGFFGGIRDRFAAGRRGTTQGAGTGDDKGDPNGSGAVGNPATIGDGAISSGGKKRRWIPDRGPGGRFTGGGHYEDVDDSSSSTSASGGITGSNTKGASDAGDASSDERRRLKDMAAAKTAERKDREQAAQAEREKREDQKAKADAAETAKKNGRKKSNKTDNEYLSDIEKHSRTIPKIYDEIKGQLGGTGWNIAYIKTLLDKHFGKLSDEELPEEMEGSKKNVKKRRGFFGKMFDRIAGVFGGIGEAVRDKVTGVLDIVLHPFKLLGKVVGGVVDGIKAAGETLWGIVKTLGAAVGEVLKGAAQGLASVLAGAGKIIYNAAGGIGKALGDTISTLTGVLKDGILGISAVVRGLVETAAAIAPDIAKAAWKGMKFVGGMIGKGIKFAAEGVAGGVSWLFNKITGRGEGGERIKTKIKKLGKFVIDGGYLDEIKQPLAVAVGGDAMIPFPFVRLLKGRLTRRSNIAIPVFIMGYDDGQEPDKSTPAPEPEAPKPALPTPGNVPDTNNDQAGKPQGAQPKKQSLRDTAANAASKAKAEMRRKVETFKRKYFNVDKRAEKSNNPQEEYDRAMQNATSQEEIEAVQAAQQMNANGQIIETNTGNGEKKSGLLDLLLGGLGALFGGGGIKGILSTLGKKFAASGLGQAASGFLKNTAMPALGEVAGMAATGYNLFGSKGNKLWGAESLALGANKLITTAVKGSADDVAKLGPVKKAIAKVIQALVSNATVQRMFGALKGKLGTLAAKLTEKLSGTVLEKAMKSGAAQAVQSGAKQIAAFGTGGLLAIGFAIADFVSGFGNAKKYFNVFGSDVTLGMRLTSAIVNTLGGLLSLIPAVGSFLSVAAAIFQDDIVQLVYGILAGDAAKQELAADQQKLQAATDAYNKENGTNLTVDEYAKKFNEDGSKRTFLGSLAGGVASVGKSIVGGVVGGAKKIGGAVVNGAKAVGDFALKAVTGIPDFIAKGANWIGDAASSIGTKFNEFITNLPEKISSGIDNLFGKVQDALVNLPTTMGKFVGDTIGTVIKGIGGIGEFAVKLGGGILNGMIKIAGSLPNMLLGIAKGIGNILLGGVKLIFETPKIIGDIAIGIGKGIINTIGAAIGGVNNFIAEIIKGIGNAIKEAFGGIADVVDDVVEGIPVVGDVYKGGKKVVGAVGDALGAADNFVENIPVVGSVYKGAKDLGGKALDLAENIPLLGGLVKGGRSLFGGSSSDDETGKGPGGISSEMLKRIAMTSYSMLNPMGGLMMAGAKVGGSIINNLAGDSGGGSIKSLIEGIGDKVSSAIQNAKGIAADNGLDTSSVGGFIGSALRDPKALMSSFMTIGKGIGGSLIDMVTDIFKDKKQGTTIFNMMGEGLGASLVADLKNTEGKNATITNSMSTAMVATMSGSSGGTSSINAAKKVTESSKKQLSWWQKAMPWNWGKGPGEDDWGHGPVSPMSQSASKWNRGSRDMAMNGCGPTAAAMVASAYGAKSANPGEANRMSYNMGMRASDGGTNPNFFSQYAKAHGYGMSEGPANAGRLSQNLRNGQPAVVMGKGGAFGKNMHYMVADRENGRGGVGLVDPLTGARKTTTMKGLMQNTKTALYSYGRGAWGRGYEDEAENYDEDGNLKGVSTTNAEKQQSGGNPLSKPFKITSPFGYRVLAGKAEGHQGIDIVPTDGSGQAEVGSRWNGTIKSVKRSLPNTHTGLGVKSDTAGNYVIITTDDGYIAKHFHLKYGSIPDAIQPGARVTIGQKIGEMGTTGRSTGPHLHYQLENSSGVPFDPASSVNGGTTMTSFTNGATTNTGASSTTTAGTTGNNSTSSSDGSTASTGSTMLDALSTVFSSLSGKLGNLLTILMGGNPDANMVDDPGGASTTTSGTTFNFGNTAGTTDPTEAKNITWKWLRRDFGLTEPGAAGIMGCWQSESSNNPATLEGGYLKGWRSKWSSIDEVMSSNTNLNDYTVNYLFPAYDRSGISISKSGYRMDDGNYYPGVGLAQWTRGRAYNLLKFAQDNGMDWRNVETQLKFFQHETSKSYPKLKDALNAASTPEEGARAALDGFEMYSGWSSTERGQAQWRERAKNAAQIYNTYHGTSIRSDEEQAQIEAGRARRGRGTNNTDPTLAADQQSETGAGPGWGHGPAVDLSITRDNTMAEIRKLNRLMTKTREEAQSDSTVTAIADTITKAIGGTGTGSDESTALLQTIAAAMGTMVDLLTKISKNTERGEESELAGDEASAINKRRSNLPVVSPLYPNQDKKPEDVGLTVINQLTTV